MIRNALFAAGALIALPGPALAQSCGGAPGGGAVKLVVQATDLKSDRGEVAFTVYADDKTRFLAKGGKLYRTRVPVRRPVTASCFWVKPGYYAIAQYHDENGDHSFNRTLWMPKEGFGFSNDAPTSTGLPSFASARFVVPAGGTTLRMKMRYR